MQNKKDLNVHSCFTIIPEWPRGTGGQGRQEGKDDFKNIPTLVSQIQDRTLFFLSPLITFSFVRQADCLQEKQRPGLGLGLVLDCTLGSGGIQPGPKTHHEEDTCAAAEHT